MARHALLVDAAGTRLRVEGGPSARRPVRLAMTDSTQRRTDAVLTRSEALRLAAAVLDLSDPGGAGRPPGQAAPARAGARDVHLALSWSGDLEQAFLDEAPPGEGEGTADVYEADVPAELWAAYTVAHRATLAAHHRLLELIGFDEEHGRLTNPCPAWEGDIHPGHPNWSVVLVPSGDPEDAERWPIREAHLASKPTERDAVSFVESLPEEFFVLPSHGGALEHVTRRRLRVRQSGSGPWTSRCHRCGWARSEHEEGRP